MSYTRAKITHDCSETFKFQALEYLCNDVRNPRSKTKQYTATIHVFGVTETGHSVCLSVEKFLPFFFVRIPDAKKTPAAIADYRQTIGAELTSFHRENFLEDTAPELSRTSCYGFQGSRKIRVLGLRFKSFASCQNAYRTLERKKYETFEGRVPQIFKFLHIRDAKPWVQLQPGSYEHNFTSKTQIDIKCDVDVFNTTADAKIAPIRQCTVDIETYSSAYIPGESMPPCKPCLNGDVVFQIASTFKTFGQNQFDLNHIFVLGPCDDWEGMEDVVLVRCTTEEELLRGWATLMASTDPDVIYSWNGDNFDFDYLVKRARVNNMEADFNALTSRLNLKPSELFCVHNRLDCPECRNCTHMIEKSICHICNPNALFKVERRYQMYGRIHADLYQYMMKNTKHTTYSLKNISNAYGVGSKDDVSVDMIFDSYLEKDPKKIALVAKYCVQDTRLPQLICDKLKILPALMEISNATGAPLLFVLQRGIQAKTISILSKYTRNMGMLIPDLKEENDTTLIPEESHETPVKASSCWLTEMGNAKRKMELDDTPIKRTKYEGATVLPPKVGAYYKPIVTLDFASLYPSIIRSENICYSTLIIDDVELPENQVLTVTWKDSETNGVYTNRFVKSTVQEGVLPKILTMLAGLRKAAKKELAKEENSENPDRFLCDILDARQLAIKLVMNGIYGFTATASLPCKAVSASITAVGRRMIDRTKNYIESTWAHSQIIYGDTDSVFVDFNRPNMSMNELFKFATAAGKHITNALFKAPHDLEFEKVYNPLFMLAKKRYFGMKYTDPEKPGKVENKGVIIARRDVCNFIKDAFSKCQLELLHGGQNGTVSAINVVQETLDELVSVYKKHSRDVDLNKFAITKTWKGGYRSPMSIPHAKVAEDMRNNGESVSPGDKITYVFSTERFLNGKGGSTKSVGLSAKASSVHHIVHTNRFVIDAIHYMRLLEQPISQFMILVAPDISKMFQQAENDINRITGKQKSIKSYVHTEYAKGKGKGPAI